MPPGKLRPASQTWPRKLAGGIRLKTRSTLALFLKICSLVGISMAVLGTQILELDVSQIMKNAHFCDALSIAFKQCNFLALSTSLALKRAYVVRKLHKRPPTELMQSEVLHRTCHVQNNISTSLFLRLYKVKIRLTDTTALFITI